MKFEKEGGHHIVWNYRKSWSIAGGMYNNRNDTETPDTTGWEVNTQRTLHATKAVYQEWTPVLSYHKIPQEEQVRRSLAKRKTVNDEEAQKKRAAEQTKSRRR